MADIDVSHYNSGTATVAANGTAVTGQGTLWASAVRPGDLFGTHRGAGIRVASVNSNTSLTLAYPWTGGAQTAAAYEIQRTPYELGYQQAVEDLLKGLQEGNIPAFNALIAEAGHLPMFDSSGTMTLVPRTDLISSLEFDERVGALPDRAAYDDEHGPSGATSGFRIVVDDTGDGRSAMYEKLSDTSGDWSDPIYLTGPQGNEGPMGPRGVTPRGSYGESTEYSLGDGVQREGSSWVYVNTSPSTGVAPPSLPTTSNAYWELLARAGNDGTGTVTSIVEGDGISVDNTDPENPIVSATGGGTVKAIVPGTNVSVDNGDPENPIVNSVGSTAVHVNMWSGNGSTTEFTLDVEPISAAHVFVTIDGVLQSTEAYTVSGTTLSFAEPPPGSGLENNISARVVSLADGEDVPPNGSVTTARMANNAATFAKMQDIATMMLMGRLSAGSGDPEQVPISDLMEYGSDANGHWLRLPIFGIQFVWGVQGSAPINSAYGQIFRSSTDVSITWPKPFTSMGFVNASVGSVGTGSGGRWADYNTISVTGGTIRMYSGSSSPTEVTPSFFAIGTY